ncbi:heparan sulfate glucosamine 3-O-sulfotransferase 2 [Platysternon megacephalum]|uniref:Heparan sulfate glucosamine 3-O-sulfotransferase 2 n=1 Tax=Platysternon megacephalum TaxID=55544 RepID=A0A4D9EJQ0_9SAUR|nr:heparan sulfate glucosamine 3-O-sulfotransferase 2 [Platysternon megacephalum]
MTLVYFTVWLIWYFESTLAFSSQNYEKFPSFGHSSPDSNPWGCYKSATIIYFGKLTWMWKDEVEEIDGQLKGRRRRSVKERQKARGRARPEMLSMNVICRP